ncbi:uncharacterized protein LOC106175553 [Lingula anatina]|uniref:Uncharacterized protein LOC106175553 n=1 Tax=Lingula anatina TaxID=7574 RepID=A0A1S3JSQ7_LINAN|nr:uncharacterized protein LOC106175553 [Lingula anatina]|eukprot:XP_013413069.1 uncharacterized protein LOC106175553 [Lingula anatina]
MSYYVLVITIALVCLSSQTQGEIYYADSAYDCSSDQKYVFTYSSTTLEAWSSGIRSKTNSSCVIHFYTGVSSDVVKVISNFMDIPCSSEAYLTFYDGPSTNSRLLKHYSCSVSPSKPFQTTSEYLTIRLGRAGKTNFDFSLDLYEVYGGVKYVDETVYIAVGVGCGFFFLVMLVSLRVFLIYRRRSAARRGQLVVTGVPVNCDVPQGYGSITNNYIAQPPPYASVVPPTVETPKEAFGPK